MGKINLCINIDAGEIIKNQTEKKRSFIFRMARSYKELHV